ncbi:MAG: hypothetical protein ACREBU_23225 [Nitrososphaera sp.]
MSEGNRINISKYLEKVGCYLARPSKIEESIVDLAYDLAAEIQTSLKEKEKLSFVETGQPPHLIVDPERKVISPEILAWAIAIVSSAWSEWVFAAKSNNPINQQDKSKVEAAANIKLAWPYVKKNYRKCYE